MFQRGFEYRHRQQRVARTRLVVLALLAALFAVGGLALWRSIHQRRRSQAAQWVTMRNQAIALLEDGGGAAGSELEQASRLFLELAASLPREVLPTRNLAIGQLLFLRNAETPDVDPALAAMQQMLQREDSPEAVWLAAMILRYTEREQISGPYLDRAVELIQQALSKQDPRLADDVRLRFLWYEIDINHPDPSRRQAALEALRQAYQRQPENIYLLSQLLPAEARSRSTELVDMLRAAEDTFRPVQQSIQLTSSEDVIALAGQARQAAADQRWDECLQTCLLISNFLKEPEALRRDHVALQPHPLEMVVYEFSDAFYQRATPLSPPAPPALDVAWNALPPLAADSRCLLPLDYDLDKQWELLLAGAEGVTMYERDSEGAAWAPVLQIPASSPRRLLCGDLDFDRMAVQPDGAAFPVADRHEADLDLVVCGDDQTLVLRNELQDDGSRRFQVVPQQPPLPGAGDGALVDLDHDSDLDLVLLTSDGVRLFSNRGNMTFEPATAWSQLPPASLTFNSLAIVDWDRDVDTDLILAGPGKNCVGVLENLRHGRLRWTAAPDLSTALSGSRSVAVLEEDGNVSWDYLGAGDEGLTLVHTVTPQPGVARLLDQSKISSPELLGLRTADLDNDGHVDAIAWDAAGAIWFRRQGSGKFLSVRPAAWQTPGITDARAVDLDADGDLDVLLHTPKQVVMFSNEGGNKNQWLSVRAVGQSDNAGHAGNTGVGSVIEIRSGSRYQAQVVTEQVTHFGLGNQAPDVLRILWTNGVPQIVLAPETDQVLCERMTLKGSCPYLYTWTGERFEFFTDCLWAAPLGLQTAPGQQAPSRPWEYLLIPGDRLAERDGAYELQLTEELWEAAYFDRVQLIEVLHPGDCDVFSNEKVGPASIAQRRLHTVTTRRQLRSARDSQGNDIGSLLAAADQRFAQPFARPIRQGLTPRHFIELDLGTLQDPRDIRLFLTGWIYPTNTSLNLAFTQNPDLDGPELPSVWTPDADGNWQLARAFMGFPGGKTKTIVVDLSDAFPVADYRVQIRTSAEIYWDAAFYTVDEPSREVRQTELPLLAADLHYRGFSQRLPYRKPLAERYVYEQVGTAPIWPPMRGNFTRYGDVSELITLTDDQLVVMGAGDELTLRFASSGQPLPAGWRRDFVLHAAGWDKDADMNTIHGQSVGPLPFRGMTAYPAAVGDAMPDSPAYRSYLRRYQTRQQSGRFWRLLHGKSAGPRAAPTRAAPTRAAPTWAAP